MIFCILLGAAAVMGGCLGAALAHVPGSWRTMCAATEGRSRLTGKRSGGTGDPSPTVRVVLTGALIVPVSVVLFLGGLCLWAGSRDLTAVVDRFFPDRISKLLGCGALLLLGCVLGFLVGVLRAKGPRAWFRRVAGSRLHLSAALAVLTGVLLLFLGCAWLGRDRTPTPIRLNEVCCANWSLRQDPDNGEYADYIELVNTGGAAADLGGYFISDSPKKRGRFRLPSLTLEPGECVLLWADGAWTSGQQGGKDLHLNFSLEPGERVWLSSPRGVLLDWVTVPDWYKNISLSRKDGEWVLAKGSPGEFNDWSARYTPPTLEAPVLSLASGFYDEPQTLTITAPAGCAVRYSLDGSVPSSESPLYEGPLTLTDVSAEPNRVVSQPNTTTDRSGAVTEPVDKGTVLRAAAFDETGARSETVTGVYFIGDFSAYAGSAVLSIVAAPADLFGNYGICVTGLDYDLWLENGKEGVAPWPMFNRRGRGTERDAAIQLFDKDRDLLMEEACGLRVQGDSSRNRPVKRFRLIARTFYGGSELFSEELFDAGLSHSFTTRQDSKDLSAHALLSERGLGGQAGIKANVFLNGEFYYSCSLRERYDEQYFLTHFGVDPADLILIDDDALDKGTEADYRAYRALMDYIAESDCSDPAVYAEVCRQIDPESFAAFVAANLYLNNSDWSTFKDCKLWRTRSTGGEGVLDGRWRWLIYDMDAVYWTLDFFGDTPKASYDLFTYPAPATNRPFLELPVLRELLRSPEFRDLFARTWLELMNADCSYGRWDLLQRENDYDTEFFSEFLAERPGYAVDILIEHIVPEGSPCSLSVGLSDPAGGTVKLGTTAPVFRDGTWTGTWVTGVTLRLTAEPAEGWRFVRWEGSAEGAEATASLVPSGETNVVAVFEPIQ